MRVLTGIFRSSLSNTDLFPDLVRVPFQYLRQRRNLLLAYLLRFLSKSSRLDPYSLVKTPAYITKVEVSNTTSRCLPKIRVSRPWSPPINLVRRQLQSLFVPTQQQAYVASDRLPICGNWKYFIARRFASDADKAATMKILIVRPLWSVSPFQLDEGQLDFCEEFNRLLVSVESVKLHKSGVGYSD